MNDLSELPQLKEIFASLRRGEHICDEEMSLFLHLKHYTNEYRKLFQSLGFELVWDPRGFAYFKADSEPGKEIAGCAIFVFILLEHWGNRGLNLHEELFKPYGLRFSDLPHFTNDNWTQLLSQVQVITVPNLHAVVGRLERLGMAKKITDDAFRFRLPVMRLVDVCLELLNERTNDQGENRK